MEQLKKLQKAKQINELLRLIQKGQQQTIKLNFQEQKTLKNLEKIATSVNQLQKQTNQVKEKLKKQQQVQETTKNQIKADKFEISIIEMQQSETLLRYGFDNKSIDLLDLRTFVLSSLYPMVRRIFKDFSSQAMIFQIMLNFSEKIDRKEQQRNFICLQNRIVKYINQIKPKKSLKAYLQKNKNRKMVFFCSQEKFKMIINELMEQIKEFHNELIEVKNVRLQSCHDTYQNIGYQHKKLSIGYFYANIETIASFDVLLADPKDAIKIKIENLREKTLKKEQAIFWFEILFTDDQQSKEFSEINKMMKKWRNFNIDLEQQKKIKKQ